MSSEINDMTTFVKICDLPKTLKSKSEDRASIYDDLLTMAKKQASLAYSPYSKFSVGAALMCKDGKIYLGCNIENAAYGECICAERVALFKAVSEGEREFEAIAIWGGSQPCFPCGACRQVMAEFCSARFEIITTDGVHTLAELLPRSFHLRNAKL